MSALEDTTTGGIPNTGVTAVSSTPQQIHHEGAQYVSEATQANQANRASQSGNHSGTAADEGIVPSASGSLTTFHSHSHSHSHANTRGMEDAEIRQQQPSDPLEKADHKPPKPADKKSTKLENPSAIPSAGGERLGEKHWGESQIVPDLPPKRASDAGTGVSSSDGQPTSEVANNTAANTGNATGGPGGANGASGDKPGVVEQIKDKLGMGKK